MSNISKYPRFLFRINVLNFVYMVKLYGYTVKNITFVGFVL